MGMFDEFKQEPAWVYAKLQTKRSWGLQLIVIFGFFAVLELLTKDYWVSLFYACLAAIGFVLWLDAKLRLRGFEKPQEEL